MFKCSTSIFELLLQSFVDSDFLFMFNDVFYIYIYLCNNVTLRFVNYLLHFSLFMQNMKDNPPCNTLFIGNLGENIVEEELRGIFNVYVHELITVLSKIYFNNFDSSNFIVIHFAAKLLLIIMLSIRIFILYDY